MNLWFGSHFVFGREGGFGEMRGRSLPAIASTALTVGLLLLPSGVPSYCLVCHSVIVSVVQIVVCGR